MITIFENSKGKFFVYFDIRLINIQNYLVSKKIILIQHNYLYYVGLKRFK